MSERRRPRTYITQEQIECRPPRDRALVERQDDADREP